MDGVVANFVGASIVAHGAPVTYDDIDSYNYWRKWPSNDHRGEKMGDEEFWKYCSGYDFWYNIQPYDWAYDLYKSLCKVLPVKIVTRPRYDDVGCIPAKIQWCVKHLKCSAEDVIPIHDKSVLSYEGHLLIDDCDQNVEEFNVGYGGLAVRFPANWNESYLHGWSASVDVAQRFKLEEQTIRGINDKLRLAAKRVNPKSIHAKIAKEEK
jgi:hypothetical protein